MTNHFAFGLINLCFKIKEIRWNLRRNATAVYIFDRGSKIYEKVAVVVNRHWANLQGVRMFLRHYQDREREIRGSDESHVIFADVLDAEDSRGLWLELYTDQQRKDSR